jgi:hypothetical protein
MSAFWYALAADVLVVVHLAYVSFVLFGQAAILTGWLRRWTWVHNLCFRLAHLAAIVIVAVEAVLGIPCPLTVWERDLRLAAGQTGAEGSFIGNLVHKVLFYNFPEYVFTIVYVAFALIVAGSWFLVPVRRGPRTQHIGRSPC